VIGWPARESERMRRRLERNLGSLYPHRSPITVDLGRVPADAPRRLVCGITGAAQKREGARSGNGTGRLSPRPDCGLPRTRS
jgi:hypothetical protein